MAYSALADISAEFKNIAFNSSTNVTDAAVNGFIAEADALINSYIGTRYTTPVTTAGDGLTLLKLLSRSLVSARVKTIMEVKSEKNTDASQNVRGILLSPSQCMKILNDIQQNNITLAGAAPLIASGGFYSNNAANDECPVAKKDERQW
jgi:hypothetical protein